MTEERETIFICLSLSLFDFFDVAWEDFRIFSPRKERNSNVRSTEKNEIPLKTLIFQKGQKIIITTPINLSDRDVCILEKRMKFDSSRKQQLSNRINRFFFLLSFFRDLRRLIKKVLRDE